MHSVHAHSHTIERMEVASQTFLSTLLFLNFFFQRFRSRIGFIRCKYELGPEAELTFVFLKNFQ